MRKKIRNFILFVIAAWTLAFGGGLAYGTYMKHSQMEEKRAEAIGEAIRGYNNKLSVDTSKRLARTVFYQSQAHQIDPLMVFAVMSVESRFNAHARSRMGARGLMQVMPRYHASKIKGRDINDPAVNTEIGIMIMKECKRSFPNSGTEQIFKCYLGKRDKLYNGKIKTSYQRFKEKLVVFEMINELPISAYSFHKPM